MISPRLWHRIPVRRPSPDDGFSLVELIVAGAVSVVLTAVLASILIAGMASTSQTADRDLATGTVQAISTDLSSSIRNASDVGVHNTVDGHGNDLVVVRARVAQGALNWVCRAWAIGDLGTRVGSGWNSVPDHRDELWVTSYTINTTPPTPSTSWGNLASDVQRIEIAATPAPVVPALQPYFAATGDELVWHIGVNVRQNEELGDEQTAGVSGAAVARAYDEGTGTC